MSKTIEEKIENCCKYFGGYNTGNQVLREFQPVRETLYKFRKLGGPETLDEVMEMMEILVKDGTKWNEIWFNQHPDKN